MERVKLYGDLAEKYRAELRVWLGPYAGYFQPDTDVLPLVRQIRRALDEARLVHSGDRASRYQQEGLLLHYEWAIRELTKAYPLPEGSKGTRWALESLVGVVEDPSIRHVGNDWPTFELPSPEGLPLHDAPPVRLYIASKAARHVNYHEAAFSFRSGGVGWESDPVRREHPDFRVDIPRSPLVFHLLTRGPGNPNFKRKATPAALAAFASELMARPGAERRYALTYGRKKLADREGRAILPEQLKRDIAERFEVSARTVERALLGLGWQPSGGFHVALPMTRRRK